MLHLSNEAQLFYHLTVEKVLFNKVLVIPKSWDWDTSNPGIRDWWKLPGSQDSGSKDCKHRLQTWLDYLWTWNYCVWQL